MNEPAPVRVLCYHTTNGALLQEIVDPALAGLADDKLLVEIMGAIKGVKAIVIQEAQLDCCVLVMVEHIVLITVNLGLVIHPDHEDELAGRRAEREEAS
jgi:hypothetical protein